MGKQRKARRRSLRPLSPCWIKASTDRVPSVTRFRGCIVYLYFPTLDIIAFRDPSVIAYKSHGTHLFTITLLLYLG